ncbi:TetR/AcrR family transcriptional regulator [Acidocella sp.]|uniref:TetR/AcrR family transcriptional regulator n=1 Tax=Acidocella sp. TaxID=50710 RepID=UPI00262D1534|nr:TetR/AcrR family transcriptional regulator [Acidocella sp.]
MPRPSNRERIINEGLRVVHERGFAGSSVRDIAQAASVPLGSFTNHFPSKEAFGLEVLDRYFEKLQAAMDQTLRNEALSVRARINAYLDLVIARLRENDMRGGCMVGNFSAEMADHSEVLRMRLAKIVEGCGAEFKAVMKEGVESGELRPDLDCEEAGAHVYASIQGAILIAKVLRVETPLENCRKQILRYLVK